MGIARSETQTTRLILRRLDPSYLDELCPFYCDPEAMRYIGDGKPRSLFVIKRPGT